MAEQENAQTVKEIYAAFGRGDVPAILDTLAGGFEWHHHGPPDIVPWARSRHTRDEVADFFKVLADNLEVLAFEPQEYVAQGDKVVALGVFRARVKSTGRPFEYRWAMEWTFRDDKVVQYRAYDDTAAIVAAFQDPPYHSPPVL